MPAMWRGSPLLFAFRKRIFFVLVTAGLLASCGGGKGSNTGTGPTQGTGPTLQSIAVTPGTATVAAGLTQQFTATGQYSDGSSQAIASAVWSSSSANLATISTSGLATTLKQGNVTITATSGSVSGTAALTVGAAIPTALSIVPANPTAVVGASTPTKLTAILTYSDNSTQDVSSTTTWNYENSFVVSIDNSGSATPLRVGYSTVTAGNGGFTATAPFVVTAQPEYLYFTTNAGRTASKAIVNAGSGQLRMAAYIPTGGFNSDGFSCVTTDPLGKFLYVGSTVTSNSPPTGEVQIYSINPAGFLAPLAGTPFAQSTPVGCLDFEPTGKFAYASDAVNGATTLLTFSADPSTGLLTLVNSASLPGSPSRVAIDPLGQYLYLVAFTNNYQNASVLGYSINSSTGTLTPIAGTPFAVSNLAGSFSFHPGGTVVYLANSQGASIDTYTLDRVAGTLSPLGTLATCVNPTAVRFSVDAKIAYSACSMDTAHDANSATVESFSVGTGGTLTHLNSTPSESGAYDLTVDPSGHFLYLSEVTPYIHLFQIGPDGSAKSVRRFGIPPNGSMNTALAGGTSPVQYTPTTAYISSSTNTTNSLSTYSVNTDGTLTLLQTNATPNPAFSLSIWPWGMELAAASAVSSPNLLAFPLWVTKLPGTGVSFGNGASAGGVAIDPSGRFAFETDSVNAVVYTYMESGGYWALISYQQGSTTFDTFAAGAGAGPIVIDPSGVLVYVANLTDNTISAYQYWGTSPELIESKAQSGSTYTDGSPFPLGAKPIAMAIDPNEGFLYVVCGDQTLRSYAIDYSAGGHISQVSSVPLAGAPSGVTVEATGQFVYTSDSTGVSAFSVNPVTGVLTPATLNPFITTANISGVYAEPAGKYLYVTTGTQSAPGGVYGYSIGSDGNLTGLTGNPLLTSIVPISMAFADTIQ